MSEEQKTNAPLIGEILVEGEAPPQYYQAFLQAQEKAEAAATLAQTSSESAAKAAARAEEAAEDILNAAENVAGKKPQDIKVTATFDTPVDDTTGTGSIITNGSADVSAYEIAVSIKSGATAILVDNDNIVYEYNGYRLDPNYSNAFFRAEVPNANGITVYSVTIDSEGNASRVEFTFDYVGNTNDAVLYTPQTLTAEQQAQARENIKAATIDDTKAGADAWSSKNTVDRLCPAFTESGSAVVCEPVEGYPLEVVSKIELVQSGSGDPSPDNIRPITGHSAVKLTRCGETFEIDLGQTVYGGTLDWNTGVLTMTHYGVTFTGNEQWEQKNGWISNWANYFSVKLDVNTLGTGMQAQKSLCSHFKPSGGAGDINGQMSTNYGWFCFNTNISSLNEWRAWLAEQYDNGTPVTVCYEVASPITVQLTPQEILALSGINTLYSDTGDTEVTGRANPAAIIEKLTNAILSLGGNV